MTYIVNEDCINCKHMTCVEVCPVDCFYEGKNMLVINPDECIDCGVCEPECPADAILSESALTPDQAEMWIDFNRKWSEQWPNITEARPPAADAKEWEGVPNKLKEHFSEEPGQGY